MTRGLARRQLSHEAGDGRGTRVRTAHVESARLVIALGLGYQTVPIIGAEQCPYRERANIGARLFCRISSAPHLNDPT